MNDASRPPVVLTIAGSDSGGGAGIQADLGTFAAFGCHGTSAIAALTAQHTRAVTAVHVPPVDFLAAQIDAVFDDFDVAAVKLGMLADAAVIDTVAERLRAHRARHVVLDPVMVATSGARLLAPDALTSLRAQLLPMATVVTPNLPEAALLIGGDIGPSRDAREAAARALVGIGARAVLLKGGHARDGTAADAQVEDLLLDGAALHRYDHPRLPVDAHGTGCTLASAVAAGLALGHPLARACRDAVEYVHAALRDGYRPGRSDVTVLSHLPRR